MKRSALDLDAVDRASECDRLFFEKHPATTERTRLLIPGELPDAGVECSMVTVHCLRRGVRVRRLSGCGYMLDVDNGADRHLFGPPS
jgi:hypothetical protein